MKVTEICSQRKSDWSDDLEDVEVSIEIDGKQLFSIGEGEPEDMSLVRDLSDAYNVIELMRQMYEAGKNGVEVTFETTTEEW